jgi:hypothetical protein
MHLDKEEEKRGQLKQKNTQHKISLINPIQIKKIDLDFLLLIMYLVLLWLVKLKNGLFIHLFHLKFEIILDSKTSTSEKDENIY